MAATTGGADWAALDAMLEQGDPGFVDAIRRVTDADDLGAFAARWHDDPRPASRRLLLSYLERPLNAYRHEALVKRLFKRAEAAGDAVAMARFLVALDRSVRRKPTTVTQRQSQTFRERTDAESRAAEWVSQGFTSAGVYEVFGWGPRKRSYMAYATWSEERLIAPSDTAMPRGRRIPIGKPSARPGDNPDGYRTDWSIRLRLPPMLSNDRDAEAIPEPARQKLERFRLFSTPTRHYLRRRAWRYFRRLGRQHPERYVPAISEALALYEDADAADGPALLDNWGLIHALFHHSPAIVAGRRGWMPAEGHALSELAPAPMFARLWEADPGALVRLLGKARSRVVRRWAALMIGRDPEAIRRASAASDLLDLLDHPDGEVAALAAELLRGHPGLASLDVDRWVDLAATARPEAVATLAELVRHHVEPGRPTLAQAARMAALAPAALARIGLEWLEGRTIATDDDHLAALGLLEAACVPLRPEVLGRARSLLAGMPGPPADRVLALLDSRHADARREGWAWLGSDPAADDPVVWRRLAESPHDDVRIPLFEALERRASADGEADTPRLLWATVLLNVHRGGRLKPRVVARVARRLEGHPGEADALLPILGVALRSSRAPERRAGLAAVVGLAERRPELAAPIRRAFPELAWG